MNSKKMIQMSKRVKELKEGQSEWLVIHHDGNGLIRYPEDYEYYVCTNEEMNDRFRYRFVNNEDIQSIIRLDEIIWFLAELLGIDLHTHQKKVITDDYRS